MSPVKIWEEFQFIKWGDKRILISDISDDPNPEFFNYHFDYNIEPNKATNKFKIVVIGIFDNVNLSCVITNKYKNIFKYFDKDDDDITTCDSCYNQNINLSCERCKNTSVRRLLKKNKVCRVSILPILLYAKRSHYN